jgi:hypothetical protein
LLLAVGYGCASGLAGRSLLSFSQSKNRWKNSDPWRLPFSTPELCGLAAKGLDIPKRWTAHQFVLQGRLLIIGLARLAKLTQRRATPYVAGKAVSILRGQINEVIRIASSRAPGTRKPGDSTLTLVAQHEAIWLQAIDEVFRDAGLKVQLELVPPIQSVMAQGYSKTGFLLAQPANAEVSQQIASKARDVAAKITRINQTTKDQIERVVRQGVADGITVPDVSQRLRDHMGPITHSRSLTIARTELSNAWAQGSAAAFKESNTLEIMDVIGCEAREDGPFQYKGESTCNYTGLPKTELDAFMAVGWHPNHTGTLVPAGFRDQ